ncbi:retrovirus-related Pol polyprotein from transposon 17.6 [Trichonephila clavipes]|uniref:Retrovirus-related Pol polyprotein from transposon 17.6 n=1 Tax=Trichonephila clavipes TaxID=2585209 RepID=A0A8X6RKW9_TRICX|nr:retrovirus-related Pol polyprotein from transposon 17.6 [Trichonephila clavipes]
MVLATSKQNKLEVNWIGPGKVLSRISDTNYVIDLPGRRDRSTIYHVNLLKPYHRRPELVSLVVEEVSDDIEGDAEIPYPDKQCTKFHYHEILRESQLQLKLSPSQIDELKQVITKNKDMFSPDPGTTHLMRMDIELISDKPIKTKPYRMSPRQINILREEIKRLLELGLIEIGHIIASPLTDALKGKIKKEKITWDKKCGKAFEELKAKLVSQPILFAPDFATDFILQTDASELVPVGLGGQLSVHSTVDEMASEAADCRHTYTMANCPQRRLEKRVRRKKEERTRKRELKKTRAGRFRKRRGESQSFLFRDADQESKTRMRNNALRTGPKQAVE